MLEPDQIEGELRTIGRDLFLGVECDIWRDRVVVYARLGATPNLEQALKESERLLAGVLGRLDTQNWIAAVHWSERMCWTIAPSDSRQVATRDGSRPPPSSVPCDQRSTAVASSSLSMTRPTPGQ